MSNFSCGPTKSPHNVFSTAFFPSKLQQCFCITTPLTNWPAAAPQQRSFSQRLRRGAKRLALEPEPASG